MRALTLLASIAIGLQALAGQDGGGGSGVAAEIERATNEFIRVVKDNPDIFQEVDPNQLEIADVSIKVTSGTIKSCASNAELEAYSYPEKNESVFNITSWMGKRRWFDKMLLAGHERLVLAGLEPSNRYHISNKLYEVKLKELGKKEPQTPCSISPYACRLKEDMEESLGNLIRLHREGSLTAGEYSSLVESNKNVLEVGKLSIIGFYKIELEKKWYIRDKAEKIVEYTELVDAAFSMHFNPIFEEAMEITPNEPVTCVKY